MVIWGTILRLTLGLAQDVVPRPLREDWRKDWRGGLWYWMLEAASRGAPESHAALVAHTRAAVREAFRLRFRTEQGIEAWRKLSGSPGFYLALCASLLVAVAVGSDGFRISRRLANGLPYPDADRLVILAQGPPIFGIQVGFRQEEAALFRSRSKSLTGVATYLWAPTVFHSAQGERQILAANVSGDFFAVLGIGPARLAEDSFLASDRFFERRLHGDRRQVGQVFEIGGRPLRLAGILPRDFVFLSAPVDVWTARPEAPYPWTRDWLLTLRGVVARLTPGITPASAEKELHQVQTDGGFPRHNFAMHVTPIHTLVFREVRSYAADLVFFLAAVVIWAGGNLLRDHRRGSPWAGASRYWAFFVAKSVLPLIAWFFSILEFTSANTLGITGGQTRGAPFVAWGFYAGVLLIFFFAVRDQPMRCRVCLHRLRQPLRIGVPGMILLDTAGEEVLCPQGHGSMYISASVLGSDLSGRWMGFGDAFLDPPGDAGIPSVGGQPAKDLH